PPYFSLTCVATTWGPPWSVSRWSSSHRASTRWYQPSPMSKPQHMAVSVIEPWRSRKIFGYFAGLSFEAAIRGADFQVIDLRWVIQATRSPDEVLQRCLELVEETFPFF